MTWSVRWSAADLYPVPASYRGGDPCRGGFTCKGAATDNSNAPARLMPANELRRLTPTRIQLIHPCRPPLFIKKHLA